jgi:UDP-N-acetylmuramyl pentapeptide synthase
MSAPYATVLASAGRGAILQEMSGLLTRETEVHTAAGNRLVDEVIDRYVAWRAECEAVSAAYQVCSSETGSERVLWFAAFNAALDREECAAELYSACITRLSWFLWANPEP